MNDEQEKKPENAWSIPTHPNARAEEDVFNQEVEWQLITGETTHVFFDKADLGNFLFNATNEMAAILLTDPFTETKMAFPTWKILRVVRWRRKVAT